MGKEPKLVYLLFCDGVNGTKDSNGNEKIILIDPWINYVVPFLPTQLTFTIVGGIDNLNPDNANEFKAVLLDPDKNILYTQKGKFELPEKPDKPSAPPNITFMIDLKNIQIQSEGGYTAEVYLDGEKLGEQTIPVYGREK